MSKIFRKEVSERKLLLSRCFSNHIAAAAALGKEFGIETLGIIRGDELENSWTRKSHFFSAQKRNDFQICNQRKLIETRKL